MVTSLSDLLDDMREELEDMREELNSSVPTTSDASPAKADKTVSSSNASSPVEEGTGAGLAAVFQQARDTLDGLDVNGNVEVDLVHDKALSRELRYAILDGGKDVNNIIQNRVKTSWNKRFVKITLDGLEESLASGSHLLGEVLTARESRGKLNPGRFVDGLLECVKASEKDLLNLEAESANVHGNGRRRQFMGLQQKRLLDNIGNGRALEILSQLEGGVGKNIDKNIDERIRHAQTFNIGRNSPWWLAQEKQLQAVKELKSILILELSAKVEKNNSV
jgi:hypothetical protein